MGKYTAAWNKLKPQRPKRPGGAFARFLSNYNAFNSSEDKPKVTIDNESIIIFYNGTQIHIKSVI